jgi:rhodanese-related sulfurtransferase
MGNVYRLTKPSAAASWYRKSILLASEMSPPSEADFHIATREEALGAVLVKTGHAVEGLHLLEDANARRQKLERSAPGLPLPGQRLMRSNCSLSDAAEEATTRLQRVGLGRVVGYCLANESAWREHDLDLASISTSRCSQLQENLQRDSSVQLVDVRSRAEWLKGHLPGAISVPLLDLESSAERINPAKPSLVYCHEGFRATTAASILLRESSSGEIGILIDGVEGWCAIGLPLEVPSVK